MRNITVFIVFIFLFSSVSYSQTNLVKNPDAELDEKEWVLTGEATVETIDSNNKVFTIRNGGSFMQDIKLPEEIAGKFVLLIGRGSSERVNPNGLLTGLPYLYGYLFSKNDEKSGSINTYLNNQNLLGRGSNSSEWVTMYGIFEILPGTVSTRIFLNQAEQKNLPQNGSAARFDDVGFYLFESEKEALEFLKNYE